MRTTLKDVSLPYIIQYTKIFLLIVISLHSPGPSLSSVERSESVVIGSSEITANKITLLQQVK